MGDNHTKFAKIYDKYIAKIYRFIFLKIGSQAAAEDLCSETFTKGWEAFQRQDEQNEIRNPQAFLFQIARNLVADYYRDKDKEPMVLAEYAAATLADPSQDLEGKALLASDMDGLRQTIAGLKDDYQDVIIWRYLDGLSFNEISDLMGRTEEATRVLLHRALKALREGLNNA